MARKKTRKRTGVVGNGRYAHVVGWGIEVPERILTNHDMAKIVDTSDEWIRERTGIAERRIADDQDTSVTLGARAARKALAQADMLPSEIDLIIVATSTPTHLFPATACLIQDRLGATQAGAFDVMAACTGFIYGLSLAASQIKAGLIDTALVIGTETLSRIMDWTDRRTCVLFGDGAGAFVLRVSETRGGIHDVVLHADGSGGSMLSAVSGIRPSWNGSKGPQVLTEMNGREVFRFASRIMATATEEVLARAGLKLDDIDLIVPHQANLRIIQAAARGLKLPMDRFFINIERYGNTSSASIPIAVAEAVKKGQIKSNDKLVLVGFGGGLTWGALVMEWDVKETPVSLMREVARESWYILAHVRSLLRRVLRFLDAVLFGPPTHAILRVEEQARKREEQKASRGKDDQVSD
jgi:3-oxoacyl-[acyl-carrier-protein] synthase-3